MYAAVIFLCSVLVTNANVVRDDEGYYGKDAKSPSTIEEFDAIPADVADYDENGDEEDLYVDQLEDVKMANELIRDIEAGKIKDPALVTTALIGAAKAGMVLAPHVASIRWARRRRGSRWWGKK